MLMPPGDAKWFYDPVGYGLIAGMMLCLLAAFVAASVNARSDNTRPGWKASASIATGLAFVLFGVWLFGEKERFAAMDVVQGEAIVDDLDGFRKRGAHTVDYHYTYAETGAVFRGTDTVNSGQTNMALHIGQAWPIYYLREDPGVSRIIEPHYGETWLLRGVFILAGLWLMTVGPRKILRNHVD